MVKRVKKDPAAFARVDNHQKFSTFRLIPAINQKNYFTSYLKKDSQFMSRKPRERPEEDDNSEVIVLQLGSRNLRAGLASDPTPKTLPFNVAKRDAAPPGSSETANAGSANGDADGEASSDNAVTENDTQEAEYEASLGEIRQSFLDRMKFYKTRVVSNGSDQCRQFNERQQGEPVYDDAEDNAEAAAAAATSAKVFCVEEAPAGHRLFWPLDRAVLNESPEYYASPQELLGDIYDIFDYVMRTGLGIDDLKQSQRYDVILVVPDMFERNALARFVDTLFRLGFVNVAILEEAVAATYGAGISVGCVIDIGAQTTTVSCVDDGMCIPNSRVKLDFGGEDITRFFGNLLRNISFPGSPSFSTLDRLKREYATVNEADIQVQLYRYVSRARKYDFKVYNEVMLPIVALFYPGVFTLPRALPWRHRLFPRSVDAYSGLPNDLRSAAQLNVARGTLAVFGNSSTDVATADGSIEPSAEPEEVDDADVADSTAVSRDGTPAAAAESGDVKTENGSAAAGTPAASANGAVADGKAPSSAAAGGGAAESKHAGVDPAQVVVAALDHAIIESIVQAHRHSGGSPKQYYENLLVVGGGANVPSFHAILTDRLVMWNQSQLKEIGDVAVMAVPRDLDPTALTWKGGCVYSQLKIIDEMWTTKAEWDILGERSLHYKAALYNY